MGRIWLAIVAFFRILFDRGFAEGVRRVREGKMLPEARMVAQKRPAVGPKTATRSEALGLLAALQREGRLVDFLKEDLGGYSDAQIGAAVRDVHRDCAGVVERLFGLRSVRNEAEGTTVDVSGAFNAGKVRLTGNVAGSGPFRGVLRHGGWEATKVELPEWTGDESAARVVALAEVEVEGSGVRGGSC